MNKNFFICIFLICIFAISISAAYITTYNPFTSKLDYVNDNNFVGNMTLNGSVTVLSPFNVSASWFKGAFDWLVGSSSSKYVNFNGTTFNINETGFNTTYVNSNGDTISSYLNVTGDAMFFTKLTVNQTQINNAPVACSNGYAMSFWNGTSSICPAISYAPGNLNVTGNITNVDIITYDNTSTDCNSCTHCTCYNGTHMRMNG